jgi:hypothetical protein
MNEYIHGIVVDLKQVIAPSIIVFVIAVLIAAIFLPAEAADTNKIDKIKEDKSSVALASRDHKREHEANKIVFKSKKKNAANTEAAWSTDREITLMFANNRKARKLTPKKEIK